MSNDRSLRLIQHLVFHFVVKPYISSQTRHDIRGRRQGQAVPLLQRHGGSTSFARRLPTALCCSPGGRRSSPATAASGPARSMRAAGQSQGVKGRRARSMNLQGKLNWDAEQGRTCASSCSVTEHADRGETHYSKVIQSAETIVEEKTGVLWTCIYLFNRQNFKIALKILK